MKEGSFVLFVLMRSTENGDVSDHVLGSLWKSSKGGGGAWAWFHGVWTCGVEVIEY